MSNRGMGGLYAVSTGYPEIEEFNQYVHCDANTNNDERRCQSRGVDRCMGNGKVSLDLQNQ